MSGIPWFSHLTAPASMPRIRTSDRNRRRCSKVPNDILHILRCRRVEGVGKSGKNCTESRGALRGSRSSPRIRQLHRSAFMTSKSKGAAMAWFAKKEPVNPDGEIQTIAEVLPQREQAIRDLMRFFQERGTSVPDAVRYSALFVGFAVANLMSVKGMAEADSEAQQLMKLARD